MNDPEVKCVKCGHRKGDYAGSRWRCILSCEHECVFPAPSPDAAVDGACTYDHDALTRVWKALGIDSYTGKSVDEHVAELRQRAEKAKADADKLHEKLIENNTQYAEEAIASENVRTQLAAAEARVGELETFLGVLRQDFSYVYSPEAAKGLEKFAAELLDVQPAGS